MPPRVSGPGFGALIQRKSTAGLYNWAGASPAQEQPFPGGPAFHPRRSRGPDAPVADEHLVFEVLGRFHLQLVGAREGELRAAYPVAEAAAGVSLGHARHRLPVLVQHLHAELAVARRTEGVTPRVADLERGVVWSPGPRKVPSSFTPSRQATGGLSARLGFSACVGAGVAA